MTDFEQSINELFYLFNQHSRTGGLILKDGVKKAELLRKTNNVMLALARMEDDE